MSINRGYQDIVLECFVAERYWGANRNFPNCSRGVQFSDSDGSPRGYQPQGIMEGDEVNKINEGNNPIFGKDLYHTILDVCSLASYPGPYRGATSALHHQRESRAVGSCSLAPPPE